MPPAPPHNVPVLFFYWQLQEPDAKVRNIISPWQGTSGFLANSDDHHADQLLCCCSQFYSEVVRELAVKSCFCLQVTVACRRSVALPKKPGSLKASQLIYAVLVSQLNFFASLRSNHPSAIYSSFFFPCKTFILCTTPRFTDLFPIYLTFALYLSQPISSSSLKNLNTDFCHPGLPQSMA